MIKYPDLIPECNVDTVFVETLGFRDPNHAPSISKVSSIMSEIPQRKARGFIDNDKKKPEYLLEFKEIDKIVDVRLLKHPGREHYLVVVSPAMDDFIFCLCNRLEINLSQYHFPQEIKAFRSFTKKESIKRNPSFRNLINAILQKKPEEISKIRFWIDKYSPYQFK